VLINLIPVSPQVGPDLSAPLTGSGAKVLVRHADKYRENNAFVLAFKGKVAIFCIKIKRSFDPWLFEYLF